MTTRTMRTLTAAALSAAALALAAPAIAHADGTQDPAYSHPPTTRSAPAPAPETTQQCNAATKSGHDGVTTTRHILGKRGPTSFLLVWDTENVPDKIDVLYQGKEIFTTNWVGNNIRSGNGKGSATISVPRGTDDFVDVVVHGGTRTHWTYTVHCPS